MFFSFDVDALKQQRHQELDLSRNDGTEEENGLPAPGNVLNELLSELQNIKVQSRENMKEIHEIIEKIYKYLSELLIIPADIIENSMLSDILLQYLTPKYPLQIQFLIHDLFRILYTSSEKIASIVFESSYFHVSVQMFYKFPLHFNITSPDQEERISQLNIELVPRIIHSTRFGVYYFTNVEELFFENNFKEQFDNLLKMFNECEPIVHELLNLTDTIIACKPNDENVTYVTRILSQYLLNPQYSKICADTFIRCSKLSTFFNQTVKKNSAITPEGGEITFLQSFLYVLDPQHNNYDLKAKVKCFVFLKTFLCNDCFEEFDPQYSQNLSAEIITVDFCNASILPLLNIEQVPPKYIEMVITSLLQLSLNSHSIPEVICSSELVNVFSAMVEDFQIPFSITLTCKILFASLLRTENPKLAIFVFEKFFMFLEDIFDSDRKDFHEDVLDSILSFLELMEKADKPEIIQTVTQDENFGWVRERLEECCESPIQRISHTSAYIMTRYFSSQAEEAQD